MKGVAKILAYTSPAMGHLIPMTALLSELSRRGHTIRIRTLSQGVETARQLGFVVDEIDPRIERVKMDDWKAANPVGALKRSVAAFGRRASYEVADFSDAVQLARPDAVLVDVNCWGAQSAADVGECGWASFSPYTPALRVGGVPPFGLGLKPLSGRHGRLRDAAVRTAVSGPLERPAVRAINAVREDIGVPAITSLDGFLRRPPLVYLATGKPFQYDGDWGDNVHMIGPCVPDTTSVPVPDWLAAIDRPIVLVTTSSEKQDDRTLIQTAIDAMSDEPVHVVATMPAGNPDELSPQPNATVRRFADHDLVLDRAVCAITHGGMGATQRALARGIPVCVVPFGRDQFEVARRAEVARCGTRLVGKKLSVPGLRKKVLEAMTMTDGARRVAAGFAATGGVARGADIFEQRLLQH